jgi:tripartite-type tricarboxylate transporter receptor subunit TctC
MNLPRRKFLHFLASTAVLPVAPRIAWAQTYPTRPVHLIVGFFAGSSSDTFARLIGEWLRERLGQQVVIENRTGAGTNIAADTVAHASPDGYSLLWITQSNAFNAALYDKLNFDFIRDITPVAAIVRVPNVMEVNPSVPAKTVLEFVAYAKANPGKVNMASAGTGSSLHVYGELFKMMTGVDLLHVPYRDNFFPDLIGGRVQVAFSPITSSLGYLRSGQLRALAVTTAARSDVLPDIPTVGEFVPGYEATAWFGVGAPKNTPPEIVEKLNKEINAALADPKLKARLAALGGVPTPMKPAEFGKLIADETEKWGNVIRTANIKME